MEQDYNNLSKEELIALLMSKDKENKALKDRIEIDKLTGLRSGAALKDDSKNYTIEQVQNKSMMVLSLDLKGLKIVNTLGSHLGGDKLIATAGEAIRACTRPGDVAYHPSGDEFIVMMELPQDVNLTEFAEQRTGEIRQKLQTLWAEKCASGEIDEKVSNIVKPEMIGIHGGAANISSANLQQEYNKLMEQWQSVNKNQEPTDKDKAGLFLDAMRIVADADLEARKSANKQKGAQGANDLIYAAIKNVIEKAEKSGNIDTTAVIAEIQDILARYATVPPTTQQPPEYEI